MALIINREKLLHRLEIFIIVFLACVPLAVTFPYRVNIFISWEGAYRMSQGQLPFRDFGVPLGGMYWVIPALFFKLFGPQMVTLVKAQVFINILSGLAFRSILGSLSVDKGARFAAVLLFCMSYSFFNFWPWYNHTVIVYELIALAFVLRYIRVGAQPYSFLLLFAAGIFMCFSFLTKQDGGGMAFLIGCMLLGYYGVMEKKWKPLLLFMGAFAVVLALIVLAFAGHGFGYWFNHGQPPHTARISAFDIADEFFGASQWLKFYLFIILLLTMLRYRSIKLLLADRNEFLLLLLTAAILGEAAIFQVTSYTPPDNNIFFHSFAFVYILTVLFKLFPASFGRTSVIVVGTAGVLLWWSGTYWKYMERIVNRALPHNESVRAAGGENMVNRKTYMINRDTLEIPMDKWVESGLPSFKKIYMPPLTVAGIHRLLDMDLVKSHRGQLKVLNMSELTPLAVEIPYAPERNSQLPLWYHLGVCMFNKQADTLEARIGKHYYDLVLFENIPTLNNFFPFRTRDSLRLHYRLADSFMAPRRGDTKGEIEVYIPMADSLSVR
ncbi:MAG TPA: hypothetical protein VNS58_10580 [Puia sp.]|nr:hypothetical protein [Puia sp.]